ncbi:MAG: urease accessory protein UreD [Pseudomonadota bacterium]
MKDVPQKPAGATRHQRAHGEADVALSSENGAVRLGRLYQKGSAKAFLPPAHGRRPELVFLNTSGGLTGGDRLSYGLTLGPGTAATATTQTAERIYASLGDPAEVTVRVEAGAGASLHWLPQETIVFDRACLNRRTEIELAGDAACLMSEMLVLGREAMGETVDAATLSDWREVRRDGRPVLIDPLKITDAVLAQRDNPALLDSARAMALVALVAPGAEDRLGPARDCAADAPEGVSAAVSGWDGKLVARALGRDVQALRLLVGRLLLSMGAVSLPRVWQF